MADFDRSLPPLAALVAFEAAYRHGSFTRAADELHTSQATVSRRVRELEADLGVTLFERRRYDVIATDEGETFAPSVRLALSELASTADRLRHQASGLGSLTVLVSLSLAPVAVAPMLNHVQRNHPGLNVRVLTACEPIEQTSERFDLALQYGAGGSQRYEVDPIAEEAVYPVCAPAFAAGLSDTLGAGELARLPLLHVDYDDPSWVTWSSFLASAGQDRRDSDRSRVFTSYRLCLDTAERGDGVALGWERSVRPRIEAGTLVRIPGVTTAKAGIINAYRPIGGEPNPLVDELTTVLKQALNQVG